MKSEKEINDLLAEEQFKYFEEGGFTVEKFQNYGKNHQQNEPERILYKTVRFKVSC